MFIENDYSTSLTDCIAHLDSIDIFDNGNKKTIVLNSEDFKIISNNLKQLFSTAIVAPAFGVSLHDETLRALKNDNWIQLNFKTEQTKNGLTFTKLLFKLEEISGFNIIRYNNNYDGRCIYLILENTTNLKSLLNNTAYRCN